MLQQFGQQAGVDTVGLRLATLLGNYWLGLDYKHSAVYLRAGEP